MIWNDIDRGAFTVPFAPTLHGELVLGFGFGTEGFRR